MREDLGAVDNLAITPPTFPFKVGFLPGPGSLANLFAANRPFPIPPLGAAPTQAFVPVPSFFTGFSPCSLPLLQQCSPGFSGTVQSTIELVVPSHWVVGTTQQWNVSIERQIGTELVCRARVCWDQRFAPALYHDDDQATLATTAESG